MSTRIIMALGATAMAFAVGLPAQAQTASPNPNGIDPEHYQCYEAIEPTPPFEPRTVRLKDQFAKTTVTLLGIISICAPVSKNGEIVADQRSHLVCYGFRGQQPQPQRKVVVKNQFGSQQFSVGTAGALCVPSFKDVLPQ